MSSEFSLASTVKFYWNLDMKERSSQVSFQNCLSIITSIILKRIFSLEPKLLHGYENLQAEFIQYKPLGYTS